jgi:hypothetical protein
MRIPNVIDTGKKIESCIDALWMNYREHLAMKPNDLPMYYTSERYACGYPIPSFQRELVWTMAQKTAFIESIWLGLYPGTYCIHRADWMKGGQPQKFSGWLIDGQQRLSTIQEYWEDGFKVFGLFWSELTAQEVRRFKSAKFTHQEIAVWDETKIRDLYNRMAFGGTPHRPEQVA